MNTSPKLRVVCHDIRSLHNVGAIFRTADGAGFTEVIISGYTGCPPDKRINKVALGAEDIIEWQYLETVSEVLETIKDDFVVIVEQNERSIPLRQMQLPLVLPANITLIMGSELEGAHPDFTARADCVVEIPMRGHKESLNVSVAYALAAYQIADMVFVADDQHMRSRVANRRVTPGVLTYGVTCGETPDGHKERLARNA